MSDTPVKIIVDLSKPAGERESIVPLTAEEIAEREQMAIQGHSLIFKSLLWLLTEQCLH